MEKHITLVAALNIGFGALGIILGLFIFILLVGIGVVSGDAEATAILSIVGISVGAFLIIFSIPEIIGGIGLLKRRPWSRILMLVVSVFDLLNIPIGTAIGVYTLWVLLQDKTISMLSETSNP